MKNELLNLLETEFPDIDFSSESLIDDEVLDSISLVSIISLISVEYDIEIPYEEIIPENFNSIDAICALVDSLK